MPSYTQEQVERLMAVARDVTAGVTFRERMQAIEGHLQALIPHDSLFATPFSPGHIDFQPEAARSYASEGHLQRFHAAQATYNEEYAAADPKRPLMGGPSAITILSEVVRPGAYGKDAFTGELMPLMQLKHELGTFFPLFPQELLGLGLHRDAARIDFAPAEKRLLQLVIPDVQRAARGSFFRALLAERQGGAPAPAAQALIVLGPGPELRYADPGAHALLARARAVEGDPALPDLLLADAARLLAAPLEGAFVERVLPLEPAGWLAARGGLLMRPTGPEVVFTLGMLPRGTAAYFEAEAASASLTPRERQVALFALRGLSNSEVARRLEVSQSTVALHLNSLYRKVRVSGRTDLAVRLLGLDLPPA